MPQALIHDILNFRIDESQGSVHTFQKDLLNNHKNVKLRAELDSE